MRLSLHCTRTLPREEIRMPIDKIDTQFLKGTVAAVLVKACAECAVARPDDPVQYVAGWLDKYVQNDGILKKHAISKTALEEDAEAAAKVCVYPL